ncbi:MAG: hypothetical protein U0V74_13520 [Chitinophagales bacterium]
MRKILPLLFAIALLASCNDSSKEKLKETIASIDSGDKLKTVDINRYSIGIPEYMEKMTDLNDEASLQYGDKYKEFYVIVIDETHGSVDSAFSEGGYTDSLGDPQLFNALYKLMKESYTSGVKDARNIQERDITVNNMAAKELTFNGTLDTYDVYYNVTFVKGPTQFFQVFTWTMGKYKEKYEPTMHSMINSLHEI